MSQFFSKQPGEKYTIAVEFAGKLPTGGSLSSGSVVAAAMSEAAQATTLAASAAAGALTLSLAAHPGGGALLTLNQDGVNREVVSVFSVTGSGPFTATLLAPVMKAHANAEPVSVQPGVSAEVLVSTTVTVSGTQARATVKSGLHGHSYKLTFFLTLSTGDNLEEDVTMSVVQH